MKLIKEFGIILVILFIGEYLSTLIHFPIPGSVIGMLILFLLLHYNIIHLNRVENISTFILANLSFFFIPPGVKLIASFDLLQGKWLQIIFICFITTILVMVVTSYTVQKIIERGEKNEKHLK